MITSELAELLRTHHAGPPSKPVPGFFIQEIEAPHAQRRADVIWLPLMTGLRGQIWGYKLKVSRADLMHELADPTKSDPWMRFCDQWTLVVANEEMLRGLDVPELWGILVPSGKRIMRTVRKPAVLKPAGRDSAYGKILARLHFGGEDGDTKLANALSSLESSRAMEQGLRDQVRDLREMLDAAGAVPALQEKVQKVVLATHRLASDWQQPEYLARDVPVELIAEAVVDHMRIVKRSKEIAAAGQQVSAAIVQQLRGMADRVDEHRGRLTELSAPLAVALKGVESA